ncbi:chromosomal replication initiator protein DnaA [Lamprobacter modestohalophilus]|uniref:Chromosomal replication initiator protein DnaA n=1 Tax=Lamprobacter modestohalophilus TaxID=1064514 RepID=A0A9X1B3W6_9GAMM|nr:chromosomal replication initiator protein DnaA [Lamprobacter modestohalophilus]MCF7976673.1 chromosomal replication initiator protein DnaA [Chromatiaceae bacterium]MBK1618840.1 chromosomal replication initiation protein DnaA [Lamprobacter modestohalophilus]MCF7994448.1 chromosomal replication initiator protein DnaA [Chromatiaceae bacterium]MCF8003424.1 chromosomal replication initiator protein DnaA [Chromatiaceae bacterium]MCF8014810.1 chromosomal replication initiator protein DnaA [Chromat
MPKLWDQCTSLLRQDLTDSEFNTWIMPLQASEEGERLRLFAPNRFVKDWVKQHYETQIASLCRGVSEGRVKQVSFEIGALRKQENGASAVLSSNEAADNLVLEQRRAEACLNRAFNFDTFVEGKSNQIARAASIQIGQNPGTAYNPLFVYGGVGLGKTHLMHAIGNAILEANPSSRVVYVHSERFVSDMIRALQHNEIDKFKRLYRRVNVLLIDDVQFFAGKDRSQEEFFHTFNALFEAQQQIVLSSDRFPKEVSGLEERLRSRFGWGLTVAIEPPDLETRVAILNSKATFIGADLPEDVAFFVAKRVRSNIRELEGALRRLAANSRFLGVPVTVEFAKDALRDMLVAQDKQVSIENIQKAVASHYKIRVSDLLSSSRSRSVARPRQVAMTLAKELTKHSLPEIGKAFGGRDHSTVIHAARKIAELRAGDTMIEEDYKILLRTLQN